MRRNDVVIALSVLVLALLYVFKSAFIQAPGVDASHEFNTARAFERLTRILGDEAPHPVDSDENDQVRERLLTEIRNIGYEPVVRDDFTCSTFGRSLACARVQNVLFWVGEPQAGSILLASHYDSVPAGPGASDDGAGVAASLEIAKILKTAPIDRSVLVLITDGEEAGLLGARAFVDHDPFAEFVGAVVNLEARGVTGPVSMFETSRPNGRDLRSLDGHAPLPVANSVTADIYERMPNGTDASVFLEMGIDLANYAFIHGGAFYHTPLDNLENLDQRSLFHTGANALGAIRGFDDPAPETEGNWIYADYYGLFLLKFPHWAGLPLILFGGVGALVAAVAVGGGGLIRAIVSPIPAVLLGVGASILLTMLMGMLRIEGVYSGAHPWALAGLQGSAALLGLGMSTWFLWSGVKPMRLFGFAWVWVAVIGISVSIVLPGAAILFAPALGLVGLASLIQIFVSKSIARFVYAAAGIILAISFLQMSSFGEIALGAEVAAPFSIFIVLLGLVFVPLLIREEAGPRQGAFLGTAMAVVLVGVFFVSSAIVPAYSQSSPRHLSILHVSEDGREPVWSVRTREPLPDALMEFASFSEGRHKNLSGLRLLAPAPSYDENSVSASVVSSEEQGQLALNTAAPDADQIQIQSLDGGLVIRSVSANGMLEPVGAEASFIQCHGRQCRDLEIMFASRGSDVSQNLNILALKYGLGEQAEALLQARAPNSVPVHSGDMRVSAMSASTSPER